MGEYDSPRRDLSWDLLHPLTTHRTTEDDGEDCEPSSFVWPLDSDERVLVPFYLSLNEYNVLATAIDVGSDIAYGEDALRVTWLWLRNMRCKVPICDLITDALLNCEDVQTALATLIATNPTIQDAIRGFVTEDTTINNYITEIVDRLTEEQIAGKLMPDDCANGNVAGRVIAIVERMDVINADALEIIEVGTNDEEKIAAILEGIPLLGELPIGDIIDFTQDLLEDFGENYNAAVTTEWKDAVAEDLYCLAKGKPDCALTYQDIFDYFQNRAGSGLNILSTLTDVVNFIRTGDFNTDDLIASGMYALQAGMILVGRDFFGMNLPRIGAITRDALPSSKWEDWEECGPTTYQHCWDFEVDGNGGFNLTLGTSTSAGIEDDFIFTGLSYKGIVLTRTMLAPITITRVIYTFEYTAGTLTAPAEKTSYFVLSGNELVEVETPTAPTSPQEGIGSVTGTSIFLQLLCGAIAGNADPGGSVTLKTLCIEGPGSDPFV